MSGRCCFLGFVIEGKPPALSPRAFRGNEQPKKRKHSARRLTTHLHQTSDAFWAAWEIGHAGRMSAPALPPHWRLLRTPPPEVIVVSRVARELGETRVPWVP